MSHISLVSIFKVTIQKVSKQLAKSLLVILPIAVLVTVVIVATSEVFSIIQAVEGSVFVALQNESKIVVLSKASNGPGGNFLSRFGGGGGGNNTSQIDYYTTQDQSAIQAISGVTQTQLVGTVPVRPAHIESLADNSNVAINNLSSLDSSAAQIYTTSDFSYQSGQPIPIILSANDLNVTTENWQGKTVLNVSAANGFRRNQNQAAPAPTAGSDQNPIKNTTVNADPSTLIGQNITVNFGGLSPIQDFSTAFASGAITYTKLADADIATKETARQTAISTYWDYNKINTPLKYTFKVVGVTQSADQTRTFIPTDFANQLISDYLGNEKAARNTTPLLADQYSTYTGLSYDGTSLVYDQFAGISSQINRSNNNNQANDGNANQPRAPRIPGVQIGQQSQNFIPGLVYQQDPTTQSITGEYTGFTDTNYPLQAQTMLVSLSDPSVRSSVVSKLNTAGYSFTDQDRLGAITQLKNTLQNYVHISIAIVGAIVGLLVLFAMSRFVSDSRREIGIYRALGSTRGSIRTLIVVQTMVLTLFGYIIGALIGVATVFGLANVMTSEIKSIINQIVGNTLPISKVFTASDFYHFDVQQIGIVLAGLTVVLLLISLIPAQSAAKISPIQAIREN